MAAAQVELSVTIRIGAVSATWKPSRASLAESRCECANPNPSDRADSGPVSRGSGRPLRTLGPLMTGRQLGLYAWENRFRTERAGMIKAHNGLVCRVR
jgi:hypothetical protein